MLNFYLNILSFKSKCTLFLHIFPILYSILNKLHIYSVVVILHVTKMYPINVILAAEPTRFILLDVKDMFTALQLLEIRSMPILWPMFCTVIPKSNLQRITAAHEGSLNTVSMECECTCAFDALLSLPKGPINLASSVRESTIAKVKWQWEKGKGNRS